MIVTTALLLIFIERANGFGLSRLPQRAHCLGFSSTSIELPPTHPSPPHTFAGLVEQAIQERYQNVDRVLESWRLLELGYQHKVFVGEDKTSEDNPMLYQECHSYVPGLTIQPFWNVDTVSWAQKLEAKYPIILKEFQKATANREQLQQQGNNIWTGALTEDASSYGVGWKTLVLMDRGVWDPVNVELFPKTAQAVRDAGVPAVEVFFASMEPHSRIQPHSDFTNFVLTSHLALDIPYSGTNQCRLTIADQTREWINGEVMLFDTSLMHDAVNDSDRTRYILMFRVWHPDLTDSERQALQFIYDCLNAPEIVTGATAEERERTELAMLAARTFPAKKNGSQGFGVQSTTSKSSKKKRK
ncbi:hypothetical protein FisN_24Hh175 [Fistulifera solaris]|uniref:Aspartyl/asparaginy/proline hydroxylase domain-containing protein n=1 Tax=Fistulifera solaris TaxID=1519565 RepID=A0A1Z5JVF8_FISSO|nr:hypothetical protein FisN_24Hh175 [Fistulifera solaris]|eukprot:GAX17758.1 hypothetical protein FisN_24Hh175 [Fistulifera solaris]